jgi:hypothetical protein
MPNLSEMIGRHGFHVLGALDREAAIAYLGGLQAQGDVIIIPAATTSDGTALLTGAIRSR